jgi:hypothetical protein
MRREFEMTDEEHQELVNASKPVMLIKTCGHWPRSPQENANAVWERLGKKYGFVWWTAQSEPGKSQKAFTAEVENKECDI